MDDKQEAKEEDDQCQQLNFPMKRSHKTQLQLEYLKKKFSEQVIFSPLSWSDALPLFVSRSFTAGSNIIEAGKQVSEVGFLITGLARYFYLTKDGVEFNKSFSGPGQALSSVSALVTKTASPFFVQTLEPCECLFIQYKSLLGLCEKHQEWHSLVRHFLEQLVIKKEQREADFLLFSAQERYQKFILEHVDLVDRIPNYHIASYLGITEVALSRIRKRMGMVKN